MKLGLLFLALTACGGSVSSADDDAGPLTYVPGEPVAAHHEAGVTDAAPAHDATPDAGGGLTLCCSTGQNLLGCVVDTDAHTGSWMCVDDAGTETATCNATKIYICAPGGMCRGELGVGTIVVCGTGGAS
jgi:hypothetical protein